MSSSVGKLLPNLIDPGASNRFGVTAVAGSGSVSFADTMKQYLVEVTQLQRDASQAVQRLTTGQTDDMAGVVSAMEKSELAFKTLVAIRQKLLTAYDELRNMPI